MLPHMQLIVTEDEMHLQINEFCADSLEDLRTIWHELQDKYLGYAIDFCYHNCPVPDDFMSEIGAEVLESCLETRLFQNNFTSVNGLELTTVTASNYEKFATLHDNAKDMFWTSERIKKDLSHWRISMYNDSYILMRIGSDYAEIYKLEATDQYIKASLLSHAAEYAFKSKKSNLLYMVDDDGSSELEMVQSLGFAICGKYIAYRTIVK